MRWRQRHEIIIAVDSPETPEVAFVHRAGRCLFIDADGKEVLLARLERPGHVNVERREATFVIAGALAVDKNLRAVVHAVEMPKHLLTGKRRWNFRPTAIKTDIIRRFSSAILKCRPRESLNLPVCRHGNIFPFLFIQVCGGEALHRLVGGCWHLSIHRWAGAMLQFETPTAGHGQHCRIAGSQMIQRHRYVTVQRHGRGECAQSQRGCKNESCE